MQYFNEKGGIKVGDKVTYKVWTYTIESIWNDGLINRVEMTSRFENGLTDTIRLRLNEVTGLPKVA